MENLFNLFHEKDAFNELESPSTIPAPPKTEPDTKPNTEPDTKPDTSPDEWPNPDAPTVPETIPGPKNSRIKTSGYNKSNLFKLAWHDQTHAGIKEHYDEINADPTSTISSHPIFSMDKWQEPLLHPASHRAIMGAEQAEAGTSMMEMARIAQQIISQENQYRPQLEKAAVDCVCSHLDCDRYSNMIQWDAKIVLPGQVEVNTNKGKDMKMPQKDKKDEPEIDMDEMFGDENNEEKEITSGVHRRMTLNALNQGAAMNLYKNCWEWTEDMLRNIPAPLLILYRKMGAGNHAIYFTENWANIIKSGGAAEGAVGSSEIKRPQEQKNGKYIIKARAICFPMLVYECARGLLEFISMTQLSQYDDKQNVKIHSTTDDHIHELLSWHAGPEMHKRVEEFVKWVNNENVSFTRVFNYISQSTNDDKVHEFISLVLERNFEKAKKVLLEIAHNK
jgi:hypothetical protein